MASVLFHRRKFSQAALDVLVASYTGKRVPFNGTPRPHVHDSKVLSATEGPILLRTTTLVRGISSTSIAPSGKSDSSGLHSLYHEQMKEISAEREAVFGHDDDLSNDASPTSQFETYFNQNSSPAQSQTPGSDGTAATSSQDSGELVMPPGWDREEAYAEREALYQFTQEEKSAWGSYARGSSLHKTTTINQAMFNRLMEQKERQQGGAGTQSATTNFQSTPSGFTHLNPEGDGVSMVDVGAKTVTRRVAKARSVVVFPPEVIQEFNIRTTGSQSEMVGPKGPIFETAKIAGIMGAKRTSELIPLCHPLPLDRVHIDIQLVGNNAIIECECRVTHKTGVEMEALMGASIAALTIYDMVKAVSHRVEIGKTVLVNKSGGKRNIINRATFGHQL